MLQGMLKGGLFPLPPISMNMAPKGKKKEVLLVQHEHFAFC